MWTSDSFWNLVCSCVAVWMGWKIVWRSVDGDSDEMHVYSAWFVLLTPYVSLILPLVLMEAWLQLWGVCGQCAGCANDFFQGVYFWGLSVKALKTWLLTDNFLMLNKGFVGFKLEMKGMASARPTKIKSIFTCRRHVKISNLEMWKKVRWNWLMGWEVVRRCNHFTVWRATRKQNGSLKLVRRVMKENWWEALQGGVAKNCGAKWGNLVLLQKYVWDKFQVSRNKQRRYVFLGFSVVNKLLRDLVLSKIMTSINWVLSLEVKDDWKNSS